MKTHAEFRSHKFPANEGEEEKINPGLFGERLARYLQDKLNAAGVETNKLFHEDWGWVVPIKNDQFSLWIGCGHQYGDDDQFLCFIEPNKPVIRKLSKKIDPTVQVGRIQAILEKILSSDSDIREVRWYNKNER